MPFSNRLLDEARSNSNLVIRSLSSPTQASSWPTESGVPFPFVSRNETSDLTPRYNFETWLAASEHLNRTLNAPLASQIPPLLEMFDGTRPISARPEGEQTPLAEAEENPIENVNKSARTTKTSLRFSGLKPNSANMFFKDVTDNSNPEIKFKSDNNGNATISMNIEIGNVYWTGVWAEKDKTAGGRFYNVFAFLYFKRVPLGSNKYSVNVFAMPDSLVMTKSANARLGSWVGRNSKNENQVHFAKAAAAAALAPSYSWARRTSHMNQLIGAVNDGNRTKINEMKNNFNVLSAAKKILPDLGSVVQNGSLYTHETFVSAFNRLRSALRLQTIVQFIRKEAASPKENPIIAIKGSSIDGLTNGTAAFRGFLQLHPEVNGNMPVPIMRDKKIIRYDKTFSLWVRETMISLNYTLSGRYAKPVKALLKKVTTEGSRLGFLIDGNNDAWDPKRREVRGRELQVRNNQLPPRLPLLDVDAVNNYSPTDGGRTAAQLLADIQANTMAATVARATARVVELNGIGPVLAGLVPITTNAVIDADTESLYEEMIDFLATPGVLVTGTRRVEGRDVPLTRMDIYQILFADNEAFNDRLFSYYLQPTATNHRERMEEMFAVGQAGARVGAFDYRLLAAVANGEILNFRIIEDPRIIMRLLNTLLVGNEVTQGARFEEDPWNTLVEEELRGIRRRRDNQTPYERYIGNANIQRFANDRDSLLALLRRIVVPCVRNP